MLPRHRSQQFGRDARAGQDVRGARGVTTGCRHDRDAVVLRVGAAAGQVGRDAGRGGAHRRLRRLVDRRELVGSMLQPDVELRERRARLRLQQAVTDLVEQHDTIEQH